MWVQPDDLDPDLGAVFDPLGNAVHTTLSFPLAGEDVLVTGAGPIGIMSAAIARHVGARHVVVTDVSDYRLDLARQAGADLAINVSHTSVADAQRQLGMREGFDIGLEMSGSPQAMADMLANLNHGARVAMLGLPKDPFAIDWGRVITRMITIKGIYGREMYDTWYAMSVDAPDERAAAHRRQLGHHPPLPGREVAGGVRRRPLGRVRQGRPRLVLSRRIPPAPREPSRERAPRCTDRSRPT